jgi:hypothetical protein
VDEPVRIFIMKWTKANTPPPEKYQSTVMNRIPLLIAFEPRGPEDRRHDEWPVVGCYIGGLVQEWRRDGSPSACEPTHWMPMPSNPNVQSEDQHEECRSVEVSSTGLFGDFDFRHHLHDTLILLGGRADIAQLLKKSQDYAVTEADIDMLRQYNISLIDGVKSRLASTNTVKIKK